MKIPLSSLAVCFTFCQSPNDLAPQMSKASIKSLFDFPTDEIEYFVFTSWKDICLLEPAVHETRINEHNEIKSILGFFQDLDMIDLDKFGGFPLVGATVAQVAQTFGVSTSMAEFLTGQRGLLVQSVDALVKGIPSDFDVTITIPSSVCVS